MNIIDLPTYIITVEGENNKRKTRIKSNLNNIGFKNIKYIYGVKIDKKNKGFMQIQKEKSAEVALSHIEALRNPGKMLIIEDDCLSTQDLLISITDYPKNADALYLGTSIYGMVNKISTPFGTRIKKINAKWDKPANMLGIHAILYLKEGYKRKTIKNLKHAIENKVFADEPIAEDMINNNIFSYEYPMFYQADEHNEYVTLSRLRDFLQYKDRNKIIAFSLWGDSPKYTIGAIKNAKLAKEIYPDWTCRFYLGTSVPAEIISELKELDNTEVIEMEEEGNWAGMFWRFMAANEEDVIMVSRDVDSRLSRREKAAVDEWLQGDKPFHIMRDHPYHKTEILGGMWGCRMGVLKGVNKMMEDYKKGDFWQADQNFLREKIYPLIKDKACVHDEFFENRPFPTAREGVRYVGEALDSNEKAIGYSGAILLNHKT